MNNSMNSAFKVDYTKLEDVIAFAKELEAKFPEYKQFVVKYPNHDNYNITMQSRKAVEEGAAIVWPHAIQASDKAVSPLKALYPSLKLDQVCRVCRGNSVVTMDKTRCGICKKNLTHYKKQGLETEVKEMKFLHDTWMKCKAYKQKTTNVGKLDLVITILFGKPHDSGWRSVEPTTKSVVLRMIGDSESSESEESKEEIHAQI